MATTASQIVPTKSLFDQHHPPEDALLRECVHCGFCLPACPTYQLWREEMDSPRGRIYLMNLAAQGRAEALDRTMVQHFDRCLGCMACMTACPSGVEYDKLIEATRAQVERRYKRPLLERLYRAMIFAIFPKPRRLRAMALLLWAYQKLGVQKLLRASGVLKLLPPQLQQMEALLPDVRWEGIVSRAPELVPARGKARMRVGVILGCVQRVFFAHVNDATMRVLAAEGCDVVIPKTQACCGALMTHVGREDEALDAARKMIDSFEPFDLDVIIINAAGCGSTLKQYGYLLRDDPQYRDKAQRFDSKCKDITEFLGALESQAQRHPVPMRIALQDSCHLLNAQKIQSQPRQLLAGVPQLEVLEVAENNVCCGSAGVYNLLEPRTAQELGARKAAHVLRTDADALVSANPGCLLQITREMRRAGADMPTYHIVEIVDASLRGTVPGGSGQKKRRA